MIPFFFFTYREIAEKRIQACIVDLLSCDDMWRPISFAFRAWASNILIFQNEMEFGEVRMREIHSRHDLHLQTSSGPSGRRIQA